MTKLAKPKRSNWRPSAELNDRIPPSNRFGECLDTKRQAKLAATANAILAKSGFFSPREKAEDDAVEADAIGINGLRPVWHGRA